MQRRIKSALPSVPAVVADDRSIAIVAIAGRKPPHDEDRHKPDDWQQVGEVAARIIARLPRGEP
jgi:hypothetical protein